MIGTTLRALAMLLVLSAASPAQEAAPTADDTATGAEPAEENVMDELEELFLEDPVVVVPAPAGAFAAPDIEADADTVAAYHVAQRRLYEYHAQQIDHRLAVFRWQHRSSQIIFFVVIGVVAMGLYFSWMQFHAPREGEAGAVTTIEASGTGVKLSSPVLGVVILVLSLAFFYLYLVHVYRITEIG